MLKTDGMHKTPVYIALLF